MSPCRSLVLVQVLPYPPTGGVALRNWQTLNLLKRQGDVAIFSIYKGADQASPILSQQGFSVTHYDIVSPHRPWFEKVKNRLGFLRSDGYPYADWLYTTEAAKALHQLVAKFQPTLVVFEELWLYPYLKVVKNGLKDHACAIVLDNHNIEGHKEDYRLQSRELRQIRHIENQFVQRADQTWVCSAVDVQQLQQLYGIRDTIRVIPNGVQAAFYHQPGQDHTARANRQLLFLGKFSYQPNEEAALILIHEIYPVLKQRYPDTQLWLVGRDPTAAMKTAAQAHDDIHITGMVPDVRPYLKTASMMVIPLRQGGGTRLKILEAFASHCPVVSTPKGAEGLKAQDNHHLCLGNTPKQLIEKVEYLWLNKPWAEQMTINAYKLFIQTYSWAAVSRSVISALSELMD